MWMAMSRGIRESAKIVKKKNDPLPRVIKKLLYAAILSWQRLKDKEDS